MYSVIRIKGNRSRWKGIALKPFFIAQMFTFSYGVHGFLSEKLWDQDTTAC